MVESPLSLLASGEAQQQGKSPVPAPREPVRGCRLRLGRSAFLPSQDGNYRIAQKSTERNKIWRRSPEGAVRFRSGDFLRKKKRPKQAERLTIERRKVILQIEKALARKRLAPYRVSQEKDDRSRLEL